MKRTPLFFVIAFALLALAVMPSARMEVTPISPTTLLLPPPCTPQTGLIIGEFRFRGAAGPNDEFVELYNATDTVITVCTTDGSAGWAVAARNAAANAVTTLFVIPNGTVIPARGHYLGVNNSANGYSLGSYPAGVGTTATGDITYSTGIDDNSGIALFNTAISTSFNTSTRLDAIGFSGPTGAIADLYREGTGYPPIGTGDGQYTFIRRVSGAYPVDENNNVTDLWFLSTTAGTFGGSIGSALGTPNPENLSSPVLRNSVLPAVVLDSTVAASLAPNRVRDLTSDPANNSTNGTLLFRRRVTNTSGAAITRLRFHIILLTTYPPPNGTTADLRMRTVGTSTVTNVNDAATCAATGTPATPPCTVTVQGTTLEQPPTQSMGGGYNSTVSVALPQPLAAGASVNVQFLLGLQQSGSFSFFFNQMALPPGAPPAAPSSLTPAVMSASQINLAWLDNSNDETGFKVERKTGPGGTYAQIGTVGANISVYNDSGLSSNTQYFYRVRATNSSGDSPYSSEANATTGNLPPSVSLTSPSNNQVFTAPASVSLAANASDPDGSITKVQFFQGTTLLNEDTSSPYSFSWNNVPTGSYSLTAKAFDNLGGTTTSSAVAITVNTLPAVSLTAPTNGQVFAAPANITLNATATDSDGSISKVQFFNGATLLNEDTSFPYSFAWNNVPAGSYNLTAKAFDNLGGTTTSSVIAITVNTLPTVSITSPTHPTTFVAPASFTINATASDPGGSITKVEFFDGATLLGQDTTSPYSFNVSNLSSGTHVLTAKATDNLGGTTTSSAVNAVVTNAPTTSITSPPNNAAFAAGSNITINANASDSDGSVAKVEFFRNGVLLGEDTTSPYSFTWTNVSSGTYVLTTRATDNLGVTGNSTAVNISVFVSSISRVDPINRTGDDGENPFSRNYNWSVPLIDLPGRAGLNLGLALSYNSLVWTKSGGIITYDADKGFPSPGFRLGFPVIQGPFVNPEVNKNFYLLITPDGSRVELRELATAGLFEAVDSSYLLFDSSTRVLRGYDGTQMSYVLYGSDYQCTEIKDRNGNIITINRAADGRITTIVDTLNRTITFNYNGTTLTSITQSWTVSGSSATHTWASFEYRNPDLTINTNFTGVTNVGPQNGSTLKVLSKVTLPDNSRFEFEYTSWGQVWKISKFANDGLTLLNYRSYDLPLDNSSPQSDCPRFTMRRDWAKYWNRNAGGTEQEAITSFLWQDNVSWQRPPNGTADSGILAQVSLPDGTYHKIYSHSTGWDKGLPVLTETYDSSQILKRQLTTAWEQDNTQLTVPLNPRITETNAFDPAGARKRVRIAYQLFQFPNNLSCTLPRDLFEYKANASDVLRSTRTTYNHDPVYTSRRIIDLVSERALYEGDVNASAPLVSKVTFAYDESGSIQGADAPVQHDSGYGSGFVAGRANLSSVNRHDVSNASQITTARYKYNTAGAVVSSKDASNHETTVSYTDAFAASGATLDAPRSFVTLAYPTTTNDADGFSSKARYNYDFGAVTWKQTPSPNVTTNTPGPQQTLTYDSIGRLERVTSLVNNSRKRFIYGPNYMQSWSAVNNVADESLVLQIFDGAGRVIASGQNHPGSLSGFSGQTNFYDVMGRSIKQSNPTETTITIPQSPAPINPYAWAASGDDATWIYTQQTFDWAGRPLVTTNQDGTTKIASYSSCGCAGGEVVTYTDEGTIDPFDLVTARRRQYKVYSDVLGRIEKTEQLNWEGGAVHAATVNTYNARDQVTLVRQFAGAAPADQSCLSGTCQKSEMTYDGHGRLKTSHLPEQQADLTNNPASTDHVTWDYNADDTIQKTTDPRGAVATYSYNGRHRITDISFTLLANVPTTGPYGVVPAATVSLQYDGAGNRKLMTDGLGSVTYTYDQLSRLTNETRFFSNLSSSSTGGNYALSYEYNLADQLTSLTDPFNVRVNYGFDTAGRLSGVTGSGFNVSTFLSNIQYRAWGAPKSVAHVNNRTTETTYDERLRVKTYKLLPAIPDDGIKLHNQYDYFPDGRLKKLTDLDDHDPSIIGFTDSGRWFTRVYRYDNRGRILRARGYNQPNNFEFDRPYDLAYGYDSFNHLVSRSGKYYYQTGFSESATFVNNRRQGWDHGADGQETHSTGPGMVRDLVYNAAGKMVQVKETVTATSQFSTYVSNYDGDGELVREFLQESQATSDSYKVRSSILGLVVTRLNNVGNKTGTTVHLPNRVTSARVNSTDTGNVPFPTYEDPLRYSIAGDKKAVYDPLGNHIPWQSSPQSNPPPFYPRSSASFGSLGSSFGSAQERGCSLDGVPTNCDRAMQMVNSGSATVDTSLGIGRQFLENGFIEPRFYAGEKRGWVRDQRFLHNFRDTDQSFQNLMNNDQFTPEQLEQFKKCLSEMYKVYYKGHNYDRNGEAYFDGHSDTRAPWSLFKVGTFRVTTDQTTYSANQLKAKGGPLAFSVYGEGPTVGWTDKRDPANNWIANDAGVSIKGREFLGLWVYELGNALSEITGYYHDVPADAKARYGVAGEQGAPFSDCVFGGAIGWDGGVRPPG